MLSGSLHGKKEVLSQKAKDKEKAENDNPDGENGQPPAAGEPPAAELPSDQKGADSARTFNVGDIVIGLAAKHRTKYHERQGVVQSVLARHYNVLLKEGPAKGEVHKYVHSMVKEVGAPTDPQPQAVSQETESQPQAAPTAPQANMSEGAAGWKDLEDVFDAEDTTPINVLLATKK